MVQLDGSVLVVGGLVVPLRYIRRTKENYGRIRAAERTSHAGIALVGHLGGTIHDPASELPVSNESVALLDLTPEQRAERTQRLGFEAVRNLSDTRWDMEANRLACDMFREAVHRVVKDAVVAEALVPTNTPLGCKRQVGGSSHLIICSSSLLLAPSKSPVSEFGFGLHVFSRRVILGLPSTLLFAHRK